MKTKTGSSSISFRFAICLISWGSDLEIAVKFVQLASDSFQSTSFVQFPLGGISVDSINTIGQGTEKEQRRNREGQRRNRRLTGGGRRSIAALVRGALASPVMAAPAVALSFSPLVDLVA
ncbi:hypothetical protein LXL04_025017 [Taraxacum kok-saghyz]